MVDGRWSGFFSLTPGLLPQAEWGASGLAQPALRGRATEGTAGTKAGEAVWSLKSFPWSLFGAGGEAGAGHAFAQAAFFEEILLQPPELPVEEVVGHFNQTHNHIGANGGVGVFDAFLEGFVIRAGSAVELAEAEGVAVVGCPFLDAAGADVPGGEGSSARTDSAP